MERTSRAFVHAPTPPPPHGATSTLETLAAIAEQVGEFEFAVVRMVNAPATDAGEAPELLGRIGDRLGAVREKLRKVWRDVIEA